MTAAVGYGPKTFQGILRFQRLLALARRQGAHESSLSALAVDAGYADQPHMTREVVRLAGRTPTALLANVNSTLKLSDLFKTAGGLID